MLYQANEHLREAGRQAHVEKLFAAWRDSRHSMGEQHTASFSHSQHTTDLVCHAGTAIVELV